MIRRLVAPLGCVAALALSACAGAPPTSTLSQGAEAPADTQEDTLARAPTQLTGSVFYVERIALSPDAVVHVEVVEADSGTVLAEQTLRSPGQAPLAFSVPIPSERLRTEARYTVRATITDGTRRFTTVEPVPVLTQGQPGQDVRVRVRLGG